MTSKKIRIMICGDHCWSCPDLIDRVMEDLDRFFGDQLIITCCTGDHPEGVPQSVLAACHRLNIGHEVFEDPDIMAESGAKFCLVFHRYLRNSKTTKDCARAALAAGITTWLYDSADYDRRTPLQLRPDSWLLKDKPPDPPEDILQEAMEN